MEHFKTPKLIDQKQVAEILGTSVPALNGMRYAGKLKDLPFVRIGTRIKYLQSDVDAFINNHKEGVQND